MASDSSVDGQLIWYILEDITRYLGDYRNILAVIGTVYILKKAAGLVFDLFKAFQTYFVSRLLIGSNLRKICGGKWAVITGASDGIGKAFAIELAKHKYNIVLLSRSLSKLKTVAQEIESKYDVQTKVISVDFSEQRIYEDIKTQIDGLDIGILVNNVGTHYGIPGFFLDLSEKKLRDLVSINMLSLTMMTYVILPGMCERKRGAVINLSSSAAQLPSPLITVYAATKAYVDYFSQGLSIEYSQDNIIVQSLKPYYVSTAMTYSVSPNLFVPTAENYVKSAIATLPYARRSCGYWPHGFQAWLFGFCPEWLWLRGAYYWNILLIRWIRRNRIE
ncbi:very-long-chain 3-oxoacyl-CoA reductase-like [Dendronephthya gigantea]|uniref:very-long-chain 3-oxoacyl-CoA reductase-like n=1 Tax=Dendronephthya gigantea TaxID=151771 RepID=UPI001069052B|nr:very-long-chain 3-oxoacyl-CoA reductase-like [Dendronephthya gigantea]